jgi:uncharacterized protein YciI
MRLRSIFLALPFFCPFPAWAQEAAPKAAASPAAAAQPAPQATPARPPDVITYQFGLIRKGPKWTPEQTPETRKIQEGHMANINRLAESGSLVAAGPVEAAEGSDLRGIFVFKGVSRDEAQKLADSDPAVQAGRLRLEFLDFVGTAGIGRRYAEESAKAGAAFKAEMVKYQLVLFKPGRHFQPGEQAENATLSQVRRTWMENLLKQGQVLLAGPFTGGGAYTGLFVLNVPSREAAETVMKEDPTVKTNRATYEVHGWWVAKGVVD